MSSRPVHGKTGKLVNLVNQQNEELLNGDAKNAKQFDLNERQVCDLELLMNGGFSPLEEFMNEQQYNSTVLNNRLEDGTLWGLPITLDTDDESLQVGDYIKLSSKTMGGLLAIMRIDQKYIPNRKLECEKVYGFTDLEHPSVWHLLTEKKKYNISGKIFGIRLPSRDWVDCKTPHQLREQLGDGKTTVAFNAEILFTERMQQCLLK